MLSCTALYHDRKTGIDAELSNLHILIDKYGNISPADMQALQAHKFNLVECLKSIEHSRSMEKITFTTLCFAVLAYYFIHTGKKKVASSSENELLSDSQEAQKMCHEVLHDTIETTKSILDNAFLSGDNPQLLYIRIRKYLLLEPSNQESIVRNISKTANLYQSGIIEYIGKKYPTLNKEDLDFCSLITLGFPAHSIQLLYSHTNSSSYYNKRTRLRRKMSITSEQNLETHIASLMHEMKNQGTVNSNMDC